MFKTVITGIILSTAMSTAIAAPADNKGHYLDTAKNLIGSLSYSDKQDYIAEFTELTSDVEKAAFFKKVIVAETSTKNAINFALKGEHSAVIEAHMLESGLLVEGRNGPVIDEDSDAYKALNNIRNDKREKHDGNPKAPVDRDPVGPVLGDPSNDFGGGGDLIGNPAAPFTGQIVEKLQDEGAELKELRDDFKKQSKINNQGNSISIAISTIPQAINGGNMIGVGIAQFEGQGSISIGGSTNFGSQNQYTLNFNLGKARDTGSASIGYGFAF